MRILGKRGCLTLLVVLGILIVAFQLWRLGRPYRPAQVSFKGRSTELHQTVVVPTLDSPMPSATNVVWCGTLQIAWNRLQADVLEGPPAIAGAEDVVSRLNQATLTEEDLPEGSYVAAAGFAADGIVEKVQEQMQEKFQRDVQFDGFSSGTVALAYAYLQTHVKFTIPFFENREELHFTDSEDRQTAVVSFGIRKADEYAYFQLREKVAILHVLRTQTGWTVRPDEYIVDLCRDSSPNQIVLACVPPKETLAEIVADVEAKIRDFQEDAGAREFGPNDILLVPNMNWEIDHRFAELEGSDKPFLNPGFEGNYIGSARQTILFRLDRSGAELRSQFPMPMLPGPTHYLFDRPFLLYVKKRDADRPFFVLWVDNAELLSKPQ